LVLGIHSFSQPELWVAGVSSPLVFYWTSLSSQYYGSCYTALCLRSLSVGVTVGCTKSPRGWDDDDDGGGGDDVIVSWMWIDTHTHTIELYREST